MRAVSLIAIRGYGADEVEQTFARARKLCHKLGDTPHLFPVLFGLCLFYLVRAKSPEAMELAAQLEVIAKNTGDPECVLETHGALAALAFWEGRFEETLDHVRSARALFDPEKHGHHQFVYGQDPLAYGYGYEALTLFFLGYPEQALAAAALAVEHAERGQHPLTLAGLYSFCGDLHHHLRQPVPFQHFAERTLAVATEQNLPMWAGPARGQLGLARVQLGDVEAGLQELILGLAAFRKTGAELNASFFVARLVEAYLLGGRIQEGLERIDEALSLLATPFNRYYEAELHRLKGELLLRVPDPDGALEAFERALTVSRAQHARSLELRAAMSLGGLLARGGKKAEAIALVSSVFDWFTEGHGTPDLLAARALLSEWRADPTTRTSAQA